MTEDNAASHAILREFSVGVRKHSPLQDIASQPVFRTRKFSAIKKIRIRNPLQVTANDSLFWWFINAFFKSVRNGAFFIFI